MALRIDDLPTAIRQAKQELRKRLPNYRDVFAEVDEAIRAEAGALAAQRNRGEDVIPEIQFADIAEQRVTAEQIQRIKARGAEFTMPPTDVTASKIAMLNDTCGNLIQVTQLKRWQG